MHFARKTKLFHHSVSSLSCVTLSQTALLTPSRQLTSSHSPCASLPRPPGSVGCDAFAQLQASALGWIKSTLPVKNTLSSLPSPPRVFLLQYTESCQPEIHGRGGREASFWLLLSWARAGAQQQFGVEGTSVGCGGGKPSVTHQSWSWAGHPARKPCFLPRDCLQRVPLFETWPPRTSWRTALFWRLFCLTWTCDYMSLLRSSLLETGISSLLLETHDKLQSCHKTWLRPNEIQIHQHVKCSASTAAAHLNCSCEAGWATRLPFYSQALEGLHRPGVVQNSPWVLHAFVRYLVFISTPRFSLLHARLYAMLLGALILCHQALSRAALRIDYTSE